MKKAFLLSFILAISFLAAAQDTVRYLDPWYAFTDPGMPCRTQVVDAMAGNMYFNCDSEFVAHDMYAMPGNIHTGQPYNLLYGLAVTGEYDSYNNRDFDINECVLHVYHDVYFPREHMIEYQWSVGQIVTLKTANMGFMKDCTFQYDYTDNDSIPHSKFVRCYELYFDQPVLIKGGESMYIGREQCGTPPTYGVDCTNSQCWVTVAPWEPRIANVCNTSGEFAGAVSVGGVAAAFSWGGIFPIVGLRCTAPRGVTLLDDDKIKLLWRSDTNATVFQVSVCDNPTEPELGSRTNTTDTSYSLTYLHPDSAYMVYVRKMCAFGPDTIWSDWSGPIVLGDTTGWAARSVSIIEASATEVTLTPNPAADRVTVAAEGMERVELIGVDGTVLLRKDCHGECQIDLTGLAAGLYLVRATTPRGTATRRLVVQ